MKTRSYLTSLVAVVGLAVWTWNDDPTTSATQRGLAAPGRVIGALKETLATQVRLLTRRTTFSSDGLPPRTSPARLASLAPADGAGFATGPRNRAGLGRPGSKVWWKETP